MAKNKWVTGIITPKHDDYIWLLYKLPQTNSSDGLQDERKWLITMDPGDSSCHLRIGQRGTPSKQPCHDL